ncbi:hypothetical protein [Jatrophihabitans lederbergiae]|uniref:SnoaL-like domain-containing protein n=1 Tax=Jatrophihabitans lederbergiae TaxID=3075547 RepID=A0ABU2JFU7_9ACTN|nr:hypothetical protein [Jatrophihabitans sp. DSM 44399]MDT0263616.1 hypothetical protein [Jatrophihabitans sp. DSM 44399]
MADDLELPRAARCAVGAAVGLVLLTVAGCGHSHSPTPVANPTTRLLSTPALTASTALTAPTSATPTPSVVPSAVSARAAAVASYLAMWRDFAAAGLTSDWQSPALSTHATGDALLVMSRGLYADHYNGLITKGHPVLHPTVTKATPAASPTTILISDCGDSTHWLKYVAKTGKLENDVPGGRQAITAEAKKQPEGSWKVDRFAVEGVGSC